MKLLNWLFAKPKTEAEQPVTNRGFIDFETGRRVDIVNGREVFVDGVI